MALGGGSVGAVEPQPFRPGQLITGIVDSEVWTHRAEYRGAFPATARMIAEVSGLPEDCAVQVGSQGFSASEDSPVDWTDGAPGQPVRHSFPVEAGRSGKVWVMIRTRAASASVGGWTGGSCSAAGPWYTVPAAGVQAGAGPAEFEGRPVRPPITFRFRAGSEAELAAQAPENAGTPTAGTVGIPGARLGAVWFDDGLGFGFEVPEGCTVERPTATTRRVRAPAGNPLADLVLEVRVTADGRTARQDLDEIHDRRTTGGAELHVMGPITVAGEPGLFAAHATPPSAGRGENHHADVVVRHGARLYRITFEGSRDRFESATAAYRSVVASFSFTKPQLQRGREPSP